LCLPPRKGPSDLAGSQHQGTIATERATEIEIAEIAAQEERRRSVLVLVPKGAKRTIVMLSLALASCQGPAAPAAPATATSLKLLVDSATSPLLHDLTSAYHPAGLVVTWNFQVGDTAAVLGWLKAGAAPYALTDYLVDQFDSHLWLSPVGQDGIAVVVNSSLSIANLTAMQLRMILQGRVDNWQSISGVDRPIVVVACSDQTSATAAMQSIVLSDRQITRAARLAPTLQAVTEIVGTTPGAIGYVSMGYVDSTVQTVPLNSILPTLENVTSQHYPITMPIVFAGMHEPGDDAYRSFFAWVQSPDGQAIVRRHYGGLATQ
jgi:phosphate transport system substrate-binding protein